MKAFPSRKGTWGMTGEEEDFSLYPFVALKICYYYVLQTEQIKITFLLKTKIIWYVWMLGWEQMKLEAASQNRSIWAWHRMEWFPSLATQSSPLWSFRIGILGLPLELLVSWPGWYLGLRIFKSSLGGSTVQPRLRWRTRIPLGSERVGRGKDSWAVQDWRGWFV